MARPKKINKDKRENQQESQQTPPTNMGGLNDEGSALNALDVDLTNTDVSREVLPITGLGDAIENLTSLLGIVPCEGCNKRKETINNIFPWMRKDIRELTQEEIELMGRINSNHMVKSTDIGELFKLYNSLFRTNTKRCSCPGLIKRMIGRINGIM